MSGGRVGGRPQRSRDVRSRRATVHADRCCRFPRLCCDAQPALPCRCDAARAMPKRAVADRFGRSREAAAALAEAYLRPASPEAKTFAPIRSRLSYSHQATLCRQACNNTGSNRRFVHQPVDLRQILQCVGQIRTGSFVQTLNQMSDLRRHGKPHGAMPTLLLSPSSRSQFSGASRIGSQWLGTGSSRIISGVPYRDLDIYAARATNVAKRRSKLPIWLSAASRSVPAGSPCAVSRNLASNRASSFNSSVSGTPIAHWLTSWPHLVNAVSYVECSNVAATKKAASEGREYV
jgi:hypothetical protein